MVILLPLSFLVYQPLKVYPLRLGVFANFFNLDPLVRLVDTVFLEPILPPLALQVTLSLATFFSLESIATEHLSFFSVVGAVSAYAMVVTIEIINTNTISSNNSFLQNSIILSLP